MLGRMPLWIGLSAVLLLPTTMTSQTSTPCNSTATEVLAKHVTKPLRLDAEQPDPAWEQASEITFCADWQGKNADPQRQTTVRVLWSQEMLYLRFESRFREIYVFHDSDSDGRRDQLWDRDVAEAFLQPIPSLQRAYKEFEVSPNGFWIDLDITPVNKLDLKSGLRRSVFVNDKQKRWFAELAIPMESLTQKFDPETIWHANFYRVEGPEPKRFYSAWRPTNTPEPDYHVPTAFGGLRFIE